MQQIMPISMKMHKTIENTPKGPWIKFKFLKANTNWTKNEEQSKNDAEIDCSHYSVAI